MSPKVRIGNILPVPACRDRGGNGFGIAPEIETGEYDDPMFLIEIEQAEWETAQNCSAYSANDKLIEGRTIRYVGLDAAYLVEKQTTQTLTLPFVGSRNVDDFAAGCLAIDDRYCHPVNRRQIPGVCPPRSRLAQSGWRGTRRAVGGALLAGCR